MRGSRVGAIVAAGIMLAGPLRAQARAVAILPFENTGSYGQDKEVFDALELGLPATLGSTLSAEPGLRVLDRGAVQDAMEKSQIGARRQLKTDPSGAARRRRRDPQGRLERRPEGAGSGAAWRHSAAGERAGGPGPRPAGLF